MMRSLIAALLLLPPSAQAQDCYDDLSVIEAELSEVDLEEPKRFVLCPNTTFDVGEPGSDPTVGQFPLIPRSNTEFSCGEDGSSGNLCILRGGDYGVLTFGDDFSSNVVFKGLTFENQITNSILLNQPGDYHFEDCIVRNSQNFGPVVVNYEEPDDVEDSDDPTTAEVFFSESVFTNNTQREREPGVEFGVMTVRGNGSEVEVDDCLFTANNYGDFTVAPVGYGISVEEGGGLVFKNTCFNENAFLGAAPLVLNEGSFFVLIGGYADDTPSLLLCPFAARYPTEEDRVNLNPQCIASQAETCVASIFEG